MYNNIPLPSRESLREGDIYVGPPAMGPAVVTKVNADGFEFHDLDTGYCLAYGGRPVSGGIFLREAEDKGLAIVAVGSQFKQNVFETRRSKP